MLSYFGQLTQNLPTMYANLTLFSSIFAMFFMAQLFVNSDFANDEEIERNEFLNENYFRTKNSGNWTDNDVWEVSIDGVNWNSSLEFPDENAKSVEILVTHQIVLDQNHLKIRHTSVFGTLIVHHQNFNVLETPNEFNLRIKSGGKFLLQGNGINQGTGKALVETDGIVELRKFQTGTILANQYIGTMESSLFVFEDLAIVIWSHEDNQTLASTNFPELFKMSVENTYVVFRLHQSFPNSGNFGGGTNNVFHAVLEIMGDKHLRLTGNGNKTFVGGIQGNGKLSVTYSSGSGKLVLGNSSILPTLGNEGALTIEIPHNILQFSNGGIVPQDAEVFFIHPTEENPSITRRSGILTIDGILDLGKFQLTNAELLGEIEVNGTLRTAREEGLYGTSANIVSGKLMLNENSRIVYHGQNQKISNLDYYHLELSGNGIKTPQSATKINSEGSVTISQNAIADFSTHNLASITDNSTQFFMDGGRLIVGTGGTQPNMRGVYDLTAGVVEFAGTNQNIRAGISRKYINIEITGKSVGKSNGHIVLRDHGIFSLKENSTFSIRQNSIRCFEDALIGTNTMQNCQVIVSPNAVFQTGNSQGFSGFTPSFTDDSSISAEISNIQLMNGSTVEYLGDKNQLISTQTNVGQGEEGNYFNLKISGRKISPFSGVLTVKHLLQIQSQGHLKINEINDYSPNVNVLYALKGIEIAEGGSLVLGSNAALMQDEDAINLGEIQLEKTFHFSDERKQYNFVISPLIGQNLTTLYPDIAYVLQYDEATDFFVNSNGHYIPGRGLAIKEALGDAAESLTAIFTGTPMNGGFHYPLEKQGQGYQVVGNPYPSNLDLRQLYLDNEQWIEPEFYFWDNRTNQLFEQQGPDYEGQNYAVFNAAAGSQGTGVGIACANCIDQKIPTKHTPTATAFMVQAKATAPLQFQNSQRTLQNDGPNYLGKHTTSSMQLEDDRFWLALTTPKGSTMMNAIVYFEKGNDDFSIEDTEAFNVSDELYSWGNGHQMVIQGKSAFTANDTIYLGYRTFQAGKHQIKLFQKEGVFDTEQRLILIDRYLDQHHNLSENAYGFITESGEINDRFLIVFKENEVLENIEFLNERIQVYRQKDAIIIRSLKEDLKQLKVFDFTGQLLFHEEIQSGKHHQLSKEILGQKTLFLNITTMDGKMHSYKVIAP